MALVTDGPLVAVAVVARGSPVIVGLEKSRAAFLPDTAIRSVHGSRRSKTDADSYDRDAV